MNDLYLEREALNYLGWDKRLFDNRLHWLHPVTVEGKTFYKKDDLDAAKKRQEAWEEYLKISAEFSWEDE